MHPAATSAMPHASKVAPLVATLWAVGACGPPYTEPVDLRGRPPPCEFRVETVSSLSARRLLATGGWREDLIAVGPDPDEPGKDRIFAVERETGADVVIAGGLATVQGTWGGGSRLHVATDTGLAVVNLVDWTMRPSFLGRTRPTANVFCGSLFGTYWFEPRDTEPALFFGAQDYEPERIEVRVSGPVDRLFSYYAYDDPDTCSLFALSGASPPHRLERMDLRAPRTVGPSALLRDDVFAISGCSASDDCVAVAGEHEIAQYEGYKLDGESVARIPARRVTAMVATDREVVFAEEDSGGITVARWSGEAAKLGDVVAPRDLHTSGDCAYFVDAESAAEPGRTVLRKVRFRIRTLAY